MKPEHNDFQARRLITGLDAQGRSTVVTDELTPRRMTAEAFTVCDIWESTQFPVPMDTPAVTGEVQILPAKGGFIFRVCAFAPDTSYDRNTAYEKSMNTIKGGAACIKDETKAKSAIPGMHAHDTLDVVTVIEGEVHCVLETGEYLLRKGDSIVMRGVLHTWSNKGDKPALITSILMDAAPGN